MAWKNNKPASGIPAGGEGWGGPAKGAAVDRKERSYVAGDAATKPTEAGLDRKAKRLVRAAALEDVLYDLAFDAENEMTRVNAATKLHAIYEGAPVSRNINYQTDDVTKLSDDELREELARLGGTAPSDPEGTS